ncbi:hypothetical protein ACLOJK_002524 [Asimina triloba]
MSWLVGGELGSREPSAVAGCNGCRNCSGAGAHSPRYLTRVQRCMPKKQTKCNSLQVRPHPSQAWNSAISLSLSPRSSSFVLLLKEADTSINTGKTSRRRRKESSFLAFVAGAREDGERRLCWDLSTVHLRSPRKLCSASIFISSGYASKISFFWVSSVFGIGKASIFLVSFAVSFSRFYEHWRAVWVLRRMEANGADEVMISSNDGAECAETTVEIKIKTLDSQTYTLRQ